MDYAGVDKNQHNTDFVMMCPLNYVAELATEVSAG